MPDKTYNKCVINGTTYLDLSSDTVTADKLLQGYTAHDKNGAAIVGTATTSALVISDTTDSHGGTIRTITAQDTVELTTKSITQNGTYDAEDDNYDGYSSVTVNVSGGVTPTGNIDITQAGVTDVTNYATATVPSGSATPASSITGTSATVSTGTNTLTLSKTVSNTPQVSAGYISSGTAGNSSVSLTANVTTKSAATITPGTTDQTIASGTYLTGTQTIAGDADLIASNIKKNVQIFGVTGSYEGSGGGGGLRVATATTSGGDTTSISFTGLQGEPTSFCVLSSSELSTGSPSRVASVTFDGTDTIGQLITNTNNAQVSYSDSAFSYSYSNGTLYVETLNGAGFSASTYKLVYTYGGSDIGTADVQVGSGATSITFTNLDDEPSYFSCVFKSNFSTSSGYQRVIAVIYDGTDTYGMEMDSSAKYSSSHWTYSYSNGSLTISSSGTNAGGYFHQPGYYQLTYATEGSSGNYQNKTVTPSASQQVITADSGYDALKKVTVEGDADLIASNIKNGVTIFGVTGSYDAGGGSASIDTKTLTTSGRPTSISFTSMKGEPKMFTLICTSAMSRSSNSSYYYVAHVRYNGTNTTGNCWRMSNGNWTNITSGYSFTYSGTTLTISSSGTTTTSPGAFYNNGNYELVYIY